MFDFNALNKGSLSPYTTRDIGHTFSLNICGTLSTHVPRAGVGLGLGPVDCEG